MKRLIAILLLGILTYSLVGFMLMFKIMVGQTRQNMRLQIAQNTSNQPLTVLKYNALSQSDFSEIENGELTYKGEKYDIVKQEKTGNGSIVFYCIDDKDETALISRLSNDIANNLDSQSHKNAMRFYQFMVDWYVLSSIKYYTYPPLRTKTASVAPAQCFDEPVIGFHAPPPKLG